MKMLTDLKDLAPLKKGDIYVFQYANGPEPRIEVAVVGDGVRGMFYKERYALEYANYLTRKREDTPCL